MAQHKPGSKTSENKVMWIVTPIVTLGIPILNKVLGWELDVDEIIKFIGVSLSPFITYILSRGMSKIGGPTPE